MENEIIEMFEKNNFGETSGHGRKLRIRDFDESGFRIEGGVMGAKYNKDEGLIVWGLGRRNAMPKIKVSDLNKIEQWLKSNH
ncbi:hypothetical protein [Oceanobacillus sp. FSL H7-0719]|uniref:hypothetical protein n=1 Tax=Oceanobacillus sp. FSL H7-0719 TaxID=2954507 RepID=UPI00324C19DF